MKEMAKLGITLMLICVVAGLGLAAVYAQTKPVIDQRAIDDTLNAAKAAIPGADRVEEMTEGDNVYWIGYSGATVTGVAVKGRSTGYGGPIDLIVGLDSEGKVYKVSVISMSETPGIGMRTKEDKFLSRFVGTDEPMKVDSITGASISSAAVKSGVAAARNFAVEVLGFGEAQAPIDFSVVPDGTYTGSGEGLQPLTVSVEVKGGKLVSVKVTSNDETPDIGVPAIPKITSKMVESQKAEVDAVSGATLTSQGIVEAVRNALADTQKDVQAPGKGPIDLSKVPDGTYTGSGEGLKPLTVSVEVKGGRLVSIKTVTNDETPTIGGAAIPKIISQMVESQKLEFDAISGATLTSQGMAEAVRNALAGAEK